MFLNQELKNIHEAKNRLAICCDLRRRLVQVEAHCIWSEAYHAVSNIALGVAIVEQIIQILRERKGSDR